MREGAVLHAANEHDRKSEALGGMHGHEGHLPAALTLRGTPSESATRATRSRKSGDGAPGVGEGTRDRAQFRQVFDARGVL